MKIKPQSEFNFPDRSHHQEIEQSLHQQSIQETETKQTKNIKSMLIMGGIFTFAGFLFGTDLTLFSAKAEQVPQIEKSAQKATNVLPEPPISEENLEEQLLDKLAREYPAPSSVIDEDNKKVDIEKDVLSFKTVSPTEKPLSVAKEDHPPKQRYFFDQHEEEQIISKTVSKDMTADQIFLYGIELAKIGDWQQAQENFFIAYEMQPKQADFAFNLAVSLDQLGLKNQAILFYRKSIELIQQGSSYQFNTEQVENRLSQIEKVS